MPPAYFDENALEVLRTYIDKFRNAKKKQKVKIAKHAAAEITRKDGEEREKHREVSTGMYLIAHDRDADSPTFG